MVVVIGTSSGFVASAPSADPGGSTATIDARSMATNDTSPATAAKITEVGWWCDTASEAGNFEVGLYAADGAVVPGEAGTLLEVSRVNAKGTTAGWKAVTGLDWTISPSTSYWIAVQVDNVTTTTFIDQTATGGTGYDTLTAQTTLPDPFGGGALTDADGCSAIYAVWEAAASSSGMNMQINIGDVWKNISGMQINIGDVWKNISGAQINIGDVWKTIK